MIEPKVKRASATSEDLANRRQGIVPTYPPSRNTEEGRHLSGAPCSSLRHRPIGDIYVIPLTDGTQLRVTERELRDLPEDYQTAAHLMTSQGAAPRLKRQPNPKLPAQNTTVDDLSPARTRPSATNTLPRRRRHRFPRFHFLVWVGLFMIIMTIGWYALTALGNWWTNQTNQWTYGYPRTYQTDHNVGHGTAANPMSHFIAENLNKHIIVMEIPGNDPTHAKMYIGPMLLGDGQELTPVTVSFEDVNNDGKPDLVIHVADSTFIFLNTGTGFKPAPNQ